MICHINFDLILCEISLENSVVKIEDDSDGTADVTENHVYFKNPTEN